MLLTILMLLIAFTCFDSGSFCATELPTISGFVLRHMESIHKAPYHSAKWVLQKACKSTMINAHVCKFINKQKCFWNQ